MHVDVHLENSMIYRVIFNPTTKNLKKSTVDQFICDDCGRTFGTKFSLSRHIETHQKRGKKLFIDHFICYECGRVFRKKFNLLCHILSHDKKRERTLSISKFICDVCDRVFQRKFELSRHIQSHDKKLENKSAVHQFICEKCGRVFQRRYDLKRHTESHQKKLEKQSLIKQFICNDCGKIFLKKFDLSRHIQFHHKKLEKKSSVLQFICETCGKIFQRRYDLKRHTRTKSHQKKLEKQPLIKQFICNDCDKIFLSKFDLSRHIQFHYRKWEKKSSVLQFICETCGKILHRMYDLKRHTESHQKKLEKKSLIKQFICDKCNAIFRRKFNLLRHIQSHDKELLKKSIDRFSVRKCIHCDMRALNKNILEQHYRQVHDIQLQYEKLHFASFAEFEKWRKPYYYIEVSWRTTTDIVTKFRCHRSGKYEDSCEKNNTKRKRHIKISGTKKLQGYCPSEITLRQAVSDGSCSLTHQITHVGHDIYDNQEIHFVKSKKTKKKEIVQQLFEEKSEKKVVENVHDTEIHFADISCVTTDGLKMGNDLIDYVNMFIFENRESILYYKQLGEIDSFHECLREEDIALVYQDKFQRACLVKYGHKFIAFDTMHGINPYKYLLHTMLVLDSDLEGIPVAYFICNRRDRAVIDVFIQCIREHAGIVKTRTIMSDMDEVYHKSYSNIMGDAKFELFCACHVRKMWTQELHDLITVTGLKSIHSSKSQKRKHDSDESKLIEINLPINIITAEERQRLIQYVKIKLFDLANELDPVSFQEKLTSFLSISHENVKPFIDYFKEYYVEKVCNWASCFRIHAGANTIMNIDTHRRVLKDSVGNGMKIETLATGLDCIRRYNKLLHITFENKILHPKVCNKLKQLRIRHKIAVKYFEKQSFTIVAIDNRSWRIGSFSDTFDGIQEMYLIEKVEAKECNLYNDPCRLSCTFCNSCFHEYICSCFDSAISNNMCEHIHALLLSALNQEIANPISHVEPAA